MRQKVLAISFIYSLILVRMINSGITTENVVVSLVVYFFMAGSVLARYKGAVFIGDTIGFFIVIIYEQNQRLMMTILYIFSIYVLFLVRRNQKLIDIGKKTRDTLVEKENILKNEKRMLIQNQDNEIRMAIMKERTMIARELHDNVGHMLSRSLILSGAIRTVNKDKYLEDKLEILESTLDNTLKEMRKTVHQIHNETIHVEDSINDMIKEMGDRKIKKEIANIDDLDEKIKVSVIAIVRESMSNILKHSNGDEVEIKINRFETFMNVSVYDNGKLSLEEKEKINLKLTDGIGLSGIAERARLLGGVAHIYTNQGFKIFVNIPIKTESDE